MDTVNPSHHLDTSQLNNSFNNPNGVNNENTDSNQKEKNNELPNKNKSCNKACLQDGGEDNPVSTESFLQFLSTAYKLNSFLDSHGVCSTTGNGSSSSGAFDLSQLSALQGNSECADPTRLKLKLNEVLNEGLLDSILPYLIPPSRLNASAASQPVIKKHLLEKSATGGAGGGKHSGDTKRKLKGHVPPSSDERVKSGASLAAQGKDVEVEIHVCDEVKNLKRDFKCSQKLLVSKMGYFAQVTMGQRLEDMDISVHCDINIFEWLMRWVKKDLDKAGTRVPELDCCNVIAILVSANFLQMEPLLQDCLRFCRLHMNQIIASSSNLVCVNDSVLSRIALQFSNLQVESLDDRKDKIRSRLFCKLILSLNEWPPESARGHWASTGRLYRCAHCGNLLSATYAGRIPCKSNRMSIDPSGNLTNSHERDTTWSLTEHIRALRAVLKDWGRVYWRLWAQCHLLSCLVCHQLYAVSESLACAYHPQGPQFTSLDAAKLLPSPVGRYPCCGSRAFRFESLRNSQGCHFKPHIPRTVLPAEASIQKTVETLSDLVCSEAPPPLYPPERALARVLSLSSGEGGGETSVAPWWQGLALIPPGLRLGLLHRMKSKASRGVASTERSSTSTDSTGQEADSNSTVTSVSSDDEEGEEENDLEEEEEETGSEGEEEVARGRGKMGGASGPGRAMVAQGAAAGRSSKHKTTSIRHWSLKLSTRCNQDNQREMEESQLAAMAGSLLHPNHQQCLQFQTYLGGAYMKLEQEWKEAVRRTPPPARAKHRRGT